MLILGLLGMYFDAAVVFVTNSSLFFRLAVAILWPVHFGLCNSVTTEPREDFFQILWPSHNTSNEFVGILPYFLFRSVFEKK